MTTRAKAKSGVPVSINAVIKRINRALAGQDEVMKRARSPRASQELGDYYTIDVRMNALVHRNLDPEEYARELGVLRPFERIVED